MLVIVIDGELFATRLPLASFTETVMVDVPLLPPPLATMVVGVALQVSWDAAP